MLLAFDYEVHEEVPARFLTCVPFVYGVVNWKGKARARIDGRSDPRRETFLLLP